MEGVSCPFLLMTGLCNFDEGRAAIHCCIRLIFAANSETDTTVTFLPLLSTRAGHFRYFLIFSLIKNDFLHFL